MNIEDLKKEIEELKAKMTEFEKQGKVDVWVPEYGKRYWFISGHGAIVTDIWDGRAEQLEQLAFHNVYPSSESAQSTLPEITLCNAIINACKRVEVFIPDLKDISQIKYFPIYTWRTEKWFVNYGFGEIMSPAYVSTRENCERVCELLNKQGVKL